MTEAAVSVENVSVARARVQILENITTHILSGELVGIVGPNGAGKTTFLRLLNGMIRPSSGTVRVLGSAIEGMGAGRLSRLRRRIGFVPQLTDAAGSIAFRTREVVEMGRSGVAGLLKRLSQRDRDIVVHWMEHLGIAHLADRLYQELSGGEQRKTHLARALAQEPEILLLDEPTSNLDPRWQEELSALVERIWRELRLTVLFVTHEIRLLPASTERVLLMSAGRLHGDGPPEEILESRRLSEVFGVPVEVIERDGRRYLLTGAAAVREGGEHA